MRVARMHVTFISVSIASIYRDLSAFITLTGDDRCLCPTCSVVINPNKEGFSPLGFQLFKELGHELFVAKALRIC